MRTPNYRRHAAGATRPIAWACAVLFALGLLGASAVSQEEPPVPLPAVSTAPASGPTAPPPTGPDTTIWIDDAGKPRPVVDVTYDEFNKAWQAYQGLRQSSATPHYTLRKVSGEGHQLDGRVELEARLHIELHTEEPVVVPLGFGRAILMEEQPAGLKAGDLFGYSTERETYQVILTGGGERMLTLPMLVPVAAAGERNEMSLSIPRANLSELNIQLSTTATEEAVSDGALLDVSETDQGTRLHIRGGVGRTRVEWRSPEQSGAAPQVVLTAAGELSSQFDGGSIQTHARLTVQSYGGEFERFRVRLPRGARLVLPEESNGSSLKATITSTGEPRICLVTLPEKTTGPVSVDLHADQALEPEVDLDLAGFDVLGAVKQDGYLAIALKPDSHLRWGELEGARRIAVEDLPASLQSTSISDAARYTRQQCKIPVQVHDRSDWIEAATRYHLDIRPDEAVLRVTTRYRINGAPVFDFRFDLGDWSGALPVPIEPVGLIDEENVFHAADGKFFIPLSEPQSLEVVVGFQARKLLAADGEPFSITLPQPAWPMPNVQDRPELTVTVHPSLKLEVDPQTHQSLRPVALPPEEILSDELDTLRSYKFQGDMSMLGAEAPQLVARLTQRPAKQSVRIDTVAKVTAAATHVEQRFHFEIQRQPTDSLRLAAPAELLEREDLAMSLTSSDNDGPETAIPVSWRQGASADQIMVDLPHPRIGPLTLRVTWSVDHGALALTSSAPLELALLAAPHAEHTSHVLEVRSGASPPLTLGASSGGWSVEESDSSHGLRMASSDQEPQEESNSSRGLWLESSDHETQVNLTPSSDSQATANTVVRQVWRQSWVRGDVVQQRVAWRVVSQEPEAIVTLPAGIPTDKVEVLVSGAPRKPTRLDTTNIRIAIPSNKEREFTIEVRYLEELAAEDGASLSLRPATLAGDHSTAVCYWQAILPSNRWLVGGPDSFDPAWNIAWLQGRFRRQQAKNIRQLENWVGATPQGLSLAEGEHAYLFTSLQVPRAAWKPSMVDRNLTAFLASAALLAVGLVVGYAPGKWRAAGVGVAVAVVAMAGVLYPGELALAAQAGMIGLAALAVGWLTMLTLGPPRPIQVELSGDSTSIRRPTSSVEGPIGLEVGGASTSAPTVSMPGGDAHR